MKHTIQYDDEFELVRSSIVGNLGGQEADSMVESFLEFLKDKPVRQVLFDLDEAGVVEKRQDRKNIVEMLKRIQVTEVAVVGGSAVARMLAKIIYKMSGQEYVMKFFKTDEEAVEWLKNSRRAA